MKFDLDVPVIGILRGIEEDSFGAVMDRSFEAGLQAIEVTLNTHNALDIIAKNRGRVHGAKMLGMGTICTVGEAQQAVEAGAMFLVTPNFDREVIRYADSHAIPVIAGALTPTEIFAARQCGAAMIKVFPCKAMGGPQYIRDLRGPFDTIPLAAVGGVSVENVGEYFQAGVNAVGVSSALFGKEALAQLNLPEIAKNVEKFIRKIRKLSSRS